MVNVPFAIWIIFMVTDHNGGGEVRKTYLMKSSDIYDKHGERYFYFADANFFGPGRKGKERAGKLASLIVDNGINIKFGIECRVNDVEGCDY